MSGLNCYSRFEPGKSSGIDDEHGQHPVASRRRQQAGRLDDDSSIQKAAALASPTGWNDEPATAVTGVR